MMRLIHFIAFVSICSILHAQELKFIHGTPTEGPRNYYDKKYGLEEFSINSFDTVSMTAYKDGREIFKDYINYSSRSTFDLTKIGDNKETKFRELLNVGGKFYAIYSTPKGSEQTVTIQEISPDLKTTGKSYNLGTLQTSDEDNSGYLVHVSETGMLYFLTYQQNKILVKSFDDSFKEISAKTFELKTEGLLLKGFGANNEGNIYVGGVYRKKREIVDPFVIAYATKTQQHQINSFPQEEGIELFNFNMSYFGHGEPLVACMYSKKRELGYNMYKIQPASLKLEKFATQPISEEFRKATVLGYKDETYEIANILKLNNGNIVFSIEAKIEQFATTNPIFSSSPTNVICMDYSGIEVWDKLVRKFQQQGAASHLIGHYLFHSNNKVYLVYNDVNANFSLNPFAEQKGWALTEKNMYVAIAEIDEKGNAKKLNLVTKNPKEVSYFVVGQTNKIKNNLFRFKITTPKGTHYSLLEIK